VLTSIQDESFSYQDIHAPGLTVDGKKITLKANIGLVSETTLVNKYIAEGIGLYRTEFLFMIRDRLPTEQEQYEIYSKVFNHVICKDVTIRALDAGYDKPLPYLDTKKEDNPALGMRGIRLLLSQPNILKPHLKAILRAGAKGNLNLLLPMISTIDELLRTKKILREIESELTEQEIEHSKNYKVGIILEVPSVIFALDSIIHEVDFVSIGTNDLFQYTFASDRTNGAINNKNLQVHPVFIRILRHIADICNKNKREDFSLSICGELAGNPFFIPLLIGSGIHELSMTPNMIPPIKNLVRKLSVSECIDITQKAITSSNENEVISILKDFFTAKKLSKLIKF
jgi:phosphotransferase system enzyme I (PtsI)